MIARRVVGALAWLCPVVLGLIIAGVIVASVATAAPEHPPVGGCHTLRCERSSCKRLCRDRVLMRYFRARPMPWCTWGPESGPVSRRSPEWSGPRYRVVNGGSGAGGKYQFIPSTWRAIGGAGAPQDARPVEQERKARVLLRVQGLGAWVNC